MKRAYFLYNTAEITSDSNKIREILNELKEMYIKYYVSKEKNNIEILLEMINDKEEENFIVAT